MTCATIRFLLVLNEHFAYAEENTCSQYWNECCQNASDLVPLIKLFATLDTSGNPQLFLTPLGLLWDLRSP